MNNVFPLFKPYAKTRNMYRTSCNTCNSLDMRIAYPKSENRVRVYKGASKKITLYVVKAGVPALDIM